MEKTCKTCRFYDTSENYCNYNANKGDTLLPNCMFITRFKHGELYLDYASTPETTLSNPYFAMQAFLENHGFSSAVVDKQFIIPLGGDCKTWSAKAD